MSGETPINNRYIVFAGDNYYPGGGLNDLVMETDDLEEAIKRAKSTKDDWGHVWDIVTREMVYDR